MLRVTGILFLLATALDAQSGGSILSGVVRNAWSRVPLRRATVTLSTTGEDPMDAVTYSDSNGAFAFSGVPSGQYVLCARYRGYDRACYGGAVERGRPVPHLMVRAPENRQDIVLAALPLGSLSGTVVDADGDPVRNATVRMLGSYYSRRVQHWRNTEQAQTDDRGQYRISFVRPGRYRMEALCPFMQASRVQADVTYGQKQADEIYNQEFYPNADNVQAAAELTLNAGNEIKGIDFTLAPVVAATVAGRVEMPPGAELNMPVTLMLLPEPPSTDSETNSAGTSPPEYRFRFNAALPGTYRLIASVKVKDKSYFSSEVIQAGANTDDLTIALTPGSPLSGHLQLEGKDAQQSGPYKVRLVPGDSVRVLGEEPVAEVQADGSFQFDDVVPGIWDIGVEPQPPGSYIRSMMLGQKDVLTDDMILKPGSREPLKIVLNMDGAIIKGTVTENGDHPAARAVVLLAPDGRFANVMSFYENRVSDESGHFTFKSVTPGRYKIYAFDRMEQGEFENPDFLKPYAASGEAFDVGDGARLERKATLIVRGESGSQ